MVENNIIEQVRNRILDAENILVALSRDPSVDDMAAAIGLTMVLDGMGKHATAIYSGETPNALKFLKPEETFEADTNSLQDFIIALNKEKADHLRYKVEGDYVRVYITPYKTTITEKDLEFSHGDFNVDLVIALDIDDVANLDAALTEYGRIMHDATAVNITTGKAGKFAEMEWSDPTKSSVCEMLVELMNSMKNEQTGKGGENAKNVEMTKEVATAFLTGIVAETDRFSNDKTTPETMNIASELMKMGADQKLVADNMQLAEENSTIATEQTEEVKPTTQSDEQKSATEQLEQMIQPISEEETAMEQLRQVANDVELPKFEPGQNPAEMVAPEVGEKEANNIPEMNFGGGDVVNIVPPSEQEDAKSIVTTKLEPTEEMPVTKIEDVSEEIELPPPPTPPVDLASEPELPKIEIKEDATLPEEVVDSSGGEKGDMQSEEKGDLSADGLASAGEGESLVDPSAFKIPNME